MNPLRLPSLFEEEAWKQRKAGQFGNVGLSDGVIECQEMQEAWSEQVHASTHGARRAMRTRTWPTCRTTRQLAVAVIEKSTHL